MIDYIAGIRNKPEADMRQFDFPPQTPGGTLAAGSNRTITLAPVPLGISSAASGQYVRIYSGTGTEEVCLINGGSASPGEPTGTIRLATVANTHTGAWKVSSATAGMSEALAFLGGDGGIVRVPRGDYDVYATATVPDSIYVIGDGPGATTLWANTTTADVIVLTGPRSGVLDLTIDSRVGSRTGRGVYAPSLSSVVYIGNVTVLNQGTGVSINCPGYVLFSIMGPNNVTGFEINSNEVYVVEVQSNSNTQYGYKILSGTGIFMTHPQAASNGISNFVSPGGATNIVISADRLLSSMTNTGHGIDFTGAGIGFVLTLTNPYIELSGRLTGSHKDKAGIAVELGALVQIVGGLANGNTGPGILVSPSGGAVTGLIISGVNVAGNGVDVTSAEDASGIKLAGSAAWTAISGNVIKGQRNAFNLSAASIANGLCITGNYGDYTGSPLYTSSPSNFNSTTKALQLSPNYWSMSALNVYASATALTVRPEDVSVFITGTTTVTSIAAGWLGRKITFIKRDGTGSVTIMGQTLAENTTLTLTFTGVGAGWY